MEMRGRGERDKERSLPISSFHLRRVKKEMRMEGEKGEKKRKERSRKG